MSDPSA